MPKAVRQEPETPRAVTYRCTRGHQWQSELSPAKNILHFPIGAAGDLQDMCPHCLFEYLKKLVTTQNLGKVEIVNE